MAWRSRIVVRPKDRLRRAYSSFPTRISVSSSSRTTAASTFARDRPRRARSRSRPAADAGQRLGEGDHPREVVGAAVGPPARVVAVLLAPACVATGRLQVPVRPRADPDVRPRGRDDDRADPLEDVRVADGCAVRVAVREATPGAMAGEARRDGRWHSAVRWPVRPRGARRGWWVQVIGHGGTVRVPASHRYGSRSFATCLQPRIEAGRGCPIGSLPILEAGPVATPALGDGRDGTPFYPAIGARRRRSSSPCRRPSDGRGHDRSCIEALRR